MHGWHDFTFGFSFVARRVLERCTRKEAGKEVGEEAGERKLAQITLLMVGQEWVEGSTTALQGFVIGLVH